MEAADIIFDIKKVDTQLAETYIKTRKDLHSIGYTGNNYCEHDKFSNIINISNIDAEPIKVDDNTSHSHTLNKPLTLAKLIQKNADLFCQLEYLIRKIPVEDVKKYDLKLIVDNLLYCNKAKRIHKFKSNVLCKKIAFLADTPLAALGFIAQSLCCGSNENNYITIISNKDTAIICSLFVDLCREVGFNEVCLQLVSKNASCSKYNILKMEEMYTGCVGIVTSKCDVDSAVDTFLSSTVWYPWRVNKIFVQECVLERFKRALAWKAEKQAPGSGEDDVEVSCAASYSCGDKVFVLEATGECGPGVVAVEAYRTVRELLALVAALRPLAASVWSSDVAESLEISHELSATVVWVNDFADFRGPPPVSQAFYSVIDWNFNTQKMQHMPEFDEISKFRDSWLRFDLDERKDLVRNALIKIDNEESQTIIETIDALTFEMDSFVYATKDMVSTGVELLPEVVLADINLDLSLICYIIKGGAVLLHLPELSLQLKTNSVFYKFYENLRTLGAPVLFTKKEHKSGTIPILRNPTYKTKVIWTSYGTIFAN